jgi:16S rRNA (guanine527-N7)-methyltransferase
MPTPLEKFSETLQIHASEFGVEPQREHVERLTDYYALLLKWNPRLHLVAPCSPEEFAIRHVLESLLLLKHLPENASVVDIGSGAGLPIIPCLLLRDELQATLVESSQKKAVFLKEALRAVRPANRARLIVERFENTPTPQVEFLTCRALDRFAEMLPALVRWAQPHSTFLIFAGESLRRQLEYSFQQIAIEHIPQSERRFLIIARREVSPK